MTNDMIDDGGYSFKARMFYSKSQQFLPVGLNLGQMSTEDLAYAVANLYFHRHKKWPEGYDGKAPDKPREYPEISGAGVPYPKARGGLIRHAEMPMD